MAGVHAVMAGWLTRVVTVTHGPRYIRWAAHVPARSIEERRATLEDLKRAPPMDAMGAKGFRAGPCGTLARAGTPGAWLHFIADLQDYAARWGANPLGEKHRIGTGPKDGARGRGDQEYLFR